MSEQCLNNGKGRCDYCIGTCTFAALPCYLCRRLYRRSQWLHLAAIWVQMYSYSSIKIYLFTQAYRADIDHGSNYCYLEKKCVMGRWKVGTSKTLRLEAATVPQRR